VPSEGGEGGPCWVGTAPARPKVAAPATRRGGAATGLLAADVRRIKQDQQHQRRQEEDNRQHGANLRGEIEPNRGRGAGERKEDAVMVSVQVDRPDAGVMRQVAVQVVVVVVVVGPNATVRRR
jgi:hypothetical protein